MNVKAIITYLWRCVAYEGVSAIFAALVVFRSGARTAIFPLLVASGGLLCLCLMLYTMKAASRGDTQRYPYGTGRLENVSAILLSLLVVLGTLLPLIKVTKALWTGETHDVQMGWAFLLLLAVSGGNFLYANMARTLRKKADNPILSSLHHIYFAGAVRYGLSCLVIGSCWLWQRDSPAFMSWLDSMAALVLSCYALYHFLPQVWTNFQALADFPLAEPDQLKIMAILARHFDAYEMPGIIRTTRRGATPVFDLELAFSATLTVGELIAREQAMRADFEAAFPGCVFRIIPIIRQNTWLDDDGRR
jgi:divalent metal cation (Fe/Co/Zn/Cd) transporter